MTSKSAAIRAAARALLIKLSQRSIDSDGASAEVDALAEAMNALPDDAKGEVMFPIQCERGAAPHPLHIPWSIAELAYGAYAARFGRNQSLKELASRGGFGPSEMDLLLPGWRDRCDALKARDATIAVLKDALLEIKGLSADLGIVAGDAQIHKVATAALETSVLAQLGDVPVGHVRLHDGRDVKVLGELPMTADGCVVGGGRWRSLTEGGEPALFHPRFPRFGDTGRYSAHDSNVYFGSAFRVDVSSCYSTSAAAVEAAKGQAQ